MKAVNFSNEEKEENSNCPLLYEDDGIDDFIDGIQDVSVASVSSSRPGNYKRVTFGSTDDFFPLL